MAATAGDLIQRARDHHAAFHRDRHPNRVCLDFLTGRQRLLFKDLADLLKDRLSQAVQIADTIAGSLIGVDDAGVPYVVTTQGDGYAVNVDGAGVPYIVGPVITLDPYADGFPLPSDSLQLLHLYATLNDGVTRVPVTYSEQSAVSKMATPGVRSLAATVNGWRLIPQKNPTDADGLWHDVGSVTIVYIAEPAELTALASMLALPSVYDEVFVYDLTAFLARRELALNPAFPADLVGFYANEAQTTLSANREHARMDHRVIKQKTVMRNR